MKETQNILQQESLANFSSNIQCCKITFNCFRSNNIFRSNNNCQKEAKQRTPIPGLAESL